MQISAPLTLQAAHAVAAFADLHDRPRPSEVIDRYEGVITNTSHEFAVRIWSIDVFPDGRAVEVDAIAFSLRDARTILGY